MRVSVERGGEWVEKKKRNRRGTRAAGKHNHHHPPYHLTPIPPSSLAWEGGAVTPQPPSPPLAAPRQLGFRFFGPPAPRLTFRKCTTPPPPPPPPHTCHCITPTHHPPSPFHMAHPKLSHNSSVSGFGLNPLPASCFASTRPHHLVHTTTPPLCTIPRCCFTWHALNRASNSSVLDFGPNPLPASRFASAQPHHHHHHLIRTTTPPLCTIPLCCFTQCA